jgi:hypothetical protein
MKTQARKMAEKMSRSKKEEDINELTREISRGGKPKGISSDIPAGIREQLVMKEREAMFKKGEENKYAKGGAVKKKVKKYADGGMAQQAELAKMAQMQYGQAQAAQTNALGDGKATAAQLAQLARMAQMQQMQQPTGIPQPVKQIKGDMQRVRQRQPVTQAMSAPRQTANERNMMFAQQRNAMPKQTPSIGVGGMTKKMAKGGMAMCGASMPPAQKGKK